MAKTGDETVAGTPQFELFEEPSDAGGSCSATLPIQREVDEFAFVRFTPVHAPEGQTVLPHYMTVAPQHFGKYQKAARQMLASATPLAGAWEPPPQLDEDTPEVTVDVATLLAGREVTVARKAQKVVLDERAVETLLSGRAADVKVDGGDTEATIRLVPKRQEAGSEPLPIGDLAAFLAQPRLPGIGAVSLTKKQVQQLRDLGRTELDVEVGGEKRELAIVIGEGHTAPVMQQASPSTASAAMASTSGRIARHWSDIDVVGFHTDTFELPVGMGFVLALPFSQRWTLNGYARGELVNSIGLAPQEEVAIEVDTWDRLKRESEETTTDEREVSGEVGFTDKPSTETMRELTSKRGWSTNVNGKVQVPVEGAQIGGGAGHTDQGDIVSVTRNTASLISEVTSRAATKVKSTRQVKVTEVVETGFEQRSTRKIKNHNLVRTLHLDYFQVLANYEVSTVLDREAAELCVLVDNLLPGPIDRHFVLQHEGVLRRVLRDASYRPGFGAARVLDAYDRHCEIVAAGACASRQAPVDGAEVLPPNARQAADTLRDAIWALYGAVPYALLDWLPAAVVAGDQDALAGYEPEPFHLELFQQWLYRSLALEQANPAWWRLAFRWSEDYGNLELLRQLLAMPRERVTAASLPNAMLGDYARLMDRLARVYGAPQTSVALRWIAFDDAGLETALQRTRAAVAGMRLPPYRPGVTTEHPPPASTNTVTVPAASSTLGKAAPKNGWEEFWDGVANFFMGQSELTITENPPKPEPPADAVEQTRPAATAAAQSYYEAADPGVLRGYPVQLIAMAQVEEAQLLAHLRLNESYYRQAIWAELDPNDRHHLLTLRGEHLHEFVENRVVGFVGTQAAMPFRLDASDRIRQWMTDTVGNNTGLDEQTGASRSVTLPTGGVHLQTRLGGCDTGESFVMEQRRLDVELRGHEVELAAARAEQQRQEARRFTMRLDQTPKPDLDDPTPNGDGEPIRISLDR
jgi:hypothetical protein